MAFSPIVTGSGLSAWAFLTGTREKQMAAFESSPLIARDTERFAARIQSVQTSEQLMDDRALLRVALGAFGLDDDIDNRAFIQRVLESDLADDRSLVNRLADKRYLALAQTFNFAGPGGPQMGGLDSASILSDKLAAIQTADDLLSDPGLLRAALKTFGLESDRGNVYFLQKVLESDLEDPASFANRLSDTRYADMARAFDFQTRAQSASGVQGFAAVFADVLPDLETAQDLLDAPELREAALEVFGLEKDFANIDRPDFLLDVLSSDPYDAESFAAQQDDPRYLALSGAFGFGDPDTATVDSPAGQMIAALTARAAPIETTADLFDDVSLTLKVMEFFDLPQGPGKIETARRYIESDPEDPISLRNALPEPRYEAFANAFSFAEPSTGRSYSPDFVDTITRNYVERQFEAGVGESDPNMRIALSMEREITQLVARVQSTDSQWFSVMASAPLRAAFEGAFRLPSSFGALDVDQQLSILKDRSERFFGTDRVSDYTDPDRLESLRRSFLVNSNLSGSGGPLTSAGIVFTLLSASG